MTSEGRFFIDPYSNFGYQLFTIGIYEPYTVSLLKTNLKPSDIFVDLGANEAYFSVIASRIVGDEGKVFAVEPQNRLQKIIAKNLELNCCNNIIVMPIVISDKNEEAFIYLSPDMDTGGSSLIRTTFYALPRQKVNAITLSEMFRQQNITKCSLLKIDIEGWEYEAILGSPALFKEPRIKAIVLSLHSQSLTKRGVREKQIIEFLWSCGYITSDNSLFILTK